jgi:hypothetical protein
MFKSQKMSVSLKKDFNFVSVSMININKLVSTVEKESTVSKMSILLLSLNLDLDQYQFFLFETSKPKGRSLLRPTFAKKMDKKFERRKPQLDNQHKFLQILDVRNFLDQKFLTAMFLAFKIISTPYLSKLG